MESCATTDKRALEIFSPEDNPKVRILDRGCGTGKSTRMIEALKRKPQGEKTLLILPLLSEVSRYQDALPGYKSPESSGKGGKHKDLIDLIAAGENIVSTHALFPTLSRCASEGLLSDYDIVIDEVPEVVRQDELVSRESFQEFYLKTGWATLEEGTGRIRPTALWDCGYHSVSDTLRKEWYHQARAGCLYLVDDSFFLWALPSPLLTECKTLTVMTFLAKGGVLTSYLRKMGIAYCLDEDHSGLEEFRIKMKSLLTVKGIPALDRMNWSYTAQAKARGTKVSRALALLRTKGLKGVPHRDLLVTSSKKNWFKPDGKPGIYSSGSRLFESNWIPNTTRGTNDHRGCTHLIYLYDQHLNPYIRRWLNISEDEARGYALSELIQWVYRSQIRDGRPVTLYLPSGRMRSILEEFLS